MNDQESTTVYVVYGADELPYRRMIYGADSQIGITPGTFYDLRTTVVPYTPEQPTLFLLKFDEQYRNLTHDVKVLREDTTFQQSEFQIRNTTDSQEETFQVQLGKGLNVFDIYVEGTKVYTFSVTATHYAKFIRAYSEAIQTNVWDPLNTLISSLYSTTATRLLDVYFGDVLNLLPNEENLLRFSQQLLASAVVRHASTEAGVLLMSSALFQNTPVVREIPTSSNLRNLWIYPIHPRGDRFDREMLVWSSTFKQGRFGTFAVLQANANREVYQTENETNIEQINTHRIQDLEVENFQDEEENLAELQVESIHSLHMDMGYRARTQVQFPGLWDSGDPPWLDQGLHFDNGTWDSGDTSGDPDRSFYIGTQIVPSNLVNNVGVGTSTLERSVSDYAVNLSKTVELTFE